MWQLFFRSFSASSFCISSCHFILFYFRFTSFSPWIWLIKNDTYYGCVCVFVCREYNKIFFIHILFACTHFFQHILSIEMEMFCLLTLSFIVNAQRSPKEEEEERTHYVLMHFYTPQHIKLIMHDTNTNKHKYYTHNCFVLEYKIYAPLI